MPSDARRATSEALAELDASFFRVRFDRLTPGQKRYLRAMAELGPGPHRSGDIAQTLGLKVTTVAPVRNSLIAKGMIYSPGHGDTAFTVPLFDGFMTRIMPDMPWLANSLQMCGPRRVSATTRIITGQPFGLAGRQGAGSKWIP